MIKYLLTIFAISIIAAAYAGPQYQKVINDVDPNAKCLDGSSPFFYLHKGSQPSNILIFFIGGGLCSGLNTNDAIEDCYKRSKTQLGSSSEKFWPKTLDSTGKGILETNPEKSKFAEWTKLVVGYCDGSLHQGYREAPIQYKDTSLYFRGAANTRAVFTWLEKNADLANADNLVVSGGSAGAIASYIWSNYAASKVVNPNNVKIIPDSGVFLKTTTYQTDFQLLLTLVKNNFQLANLDQKTPLKLCNAKYPNKEYQCLFLQNNFLEIIPQTLLVGSEYDSWIIENALKISCLSEGESGFTLKNCNSSEMESIEGYRHQFIDFIELFTMISRNSAWAIGCSNHGYTFEDQFYISPKQTVNGMLIKEAVESFVFGTRVQQIDRQSWPANKACAY